MRESEVYILQTNIGEVGGSTEGGGAGENENERWGSAVPREEKTVSRTEEKKGGDEDVDDDAPAAKHTHTHTRHFAHRK